MVIKKRKVAAPALASQEAAGVTLIEAAVAMLLLSVVVLGSMEYQYYAAIHTKIARAQIVATRIAQLLLEDWKSTGGSSKYDPSTLNLGFSTKLSIPYQWSEGIGGGLGAPLHDAVYAITVDDLPIMVMLTWKVIASDPLADIKLQEIAVIVRFGAPSGDVDSRLANMPPVILTTYVRSDASGG